MVVLGLAGAAHHHAYELRPRRRSCAGGIRRWDGWVSCSSGRSDQRTAGLGSQLLLDG